MFIQLKGDDRSIRHDSIYLEIGRCVAAVARGKSIHDLECSSTIQMATAFMLVLAAGTRTGATKQSGICWTGGSVSRSLTMGLTLHLAL